MAKPAKNIHIVKKKKKADLFLKSEELFPLVFSTHKSMNSILLCCLKFPQTCITMCDLGGCNVL